MHIPKFDTLICALYMAYMAKELVKHKKILEYYHIDKSESMAFGDGNNDIEMLEVVGTGVAMGNASEELKAIADDICASVSEDGIYHYLKKQGII